LHPISAVQVQRNSARSNDHAAGGRQEIVEIGALETAIDERISMSRFSLANLRSGLHGKKVTVLHVVVRHFLGVAPALRTSDL
jgi:hypothetical protein